MGKAKEKPSPVTKSQMEALETFIYRSNDLSAFARKTLIWMLRRTQRLTVPVSLSFPPGSEYEQLGREAAFGAHDICSVKGSTHADLVLRAMGSSMMFDSACGHYGDDGEFKSGGHTVWISPKSYDHEAKRLRLSIKRIRAVELPK